MPSSHPFFHLSVDTFDDRKQAFIQHMEFLKSMSVEELTLYKKWQRMQGYRNQLNLAAAVKGKIWTPEPNKELTSLKSLRPRIRPVLTKADSRAWDTLREFVSSHVYELNPGRFIKFLVEDWETGKYLGCVALASDMLELGTREKWIGWTKAQRQEEHRLNNIANAAVLVPTQPFGYNFLGGKLLATLVTDDSVQKEWHYRYNDELVGLTTTSLYGPSSQYNGIPFWKGLGVTSGKTFLTPDPEFYREWVDWLKQEHPDDWRAATVNDDPDGGPVSGSKLRLLAAIYKHLGLNSNEFYHGFQRGVYFCPLYENTREFLRGEISASQLVKKPMYGVDWWKPKAEHRFVNLLNQSRVSTDITFYNDLVDMPWETAKQKYLTVVGR